MATHSFDVFPASPDASGSVYPQIYSATTGTANDLWKHEVIVFDDTSTDLYAYGAFVVPANYVGSAVVKAFTVADNDVVTGKFKLGFSYRVLAADGSTDQATAQESVNVAAGTTTSGTADGLNITTIGSLTSSNFVAGRLVEYRLERLGSDATNDTMAARLLLHALSFEYADA